MKYSLTENGGYSLATITKPHANTTVAYISIDTHTHQTVHKRATELLYTDALLSGAGKYTRAMFLDAVNQLGATISASISDGILTLFIRSKADVFSKVLSLVEIMLSTPHFDTQELKRIKVTVTNAIKESREDSRAIAHEGLRNSLYSLHDRRYTYSDDALIEGVRQAQTKDLKTLHTLVRSLPWTCSIAGSTTDVELFTKLLTKLNKSKHTHPDKESLHQQKPPQPGIVVRDIPSRQNIDFSIGAPLPITLHHPDFLPLMFGLAVLGIRGFQSRLMSTVREKEGLTYDIYANLETFMSEEQGYWRTVTFFSPEKAVEGLTSTFREIKKLYEKGITEEELTLFRANLKTKQVLLGDSTGRLLHDLHAYHMQNFTLEEIATHKKRLLSLTQEEINAAIRHYLNPEILTISAAGPISTVKKDLQKFAKTVA